MRVKRMDKDVRQLVERAKKCGWRLGPRTKGGHYKLESPSGETIIVQASRPSARGLKNLRAQMMRAGIEV